MGRAYQHLSGEERTLIQLGLSQSCTLRAIACSLQRAPSLISRELERNAWTNPPTGPWKCACPSLAKTSAHGFRNSAPRGWREGHDTHRVRPKIARCGAMSHDCCAIDIRRSKSRAYCAECSRTFRCFRSVTRTSTLRFTPCGAVSWVPVSRRPASNL